MFADCIFTLSWRQLIDSVMASTSEDKTKALRKRGQRIDCQIVLNHICGLNVDTSLAPATRPHRGLSAEAPLCTMMSDALQNNEPKQFKLVNASVVVSELAEVYYS